MDNRQAGKEAAGRYAAGLVEPGMVVGLGSGSTATLFIRALAERVRAGLEVVGVPTSEASEHLARAEGIPLTTLEDNPRLDLDVDGADAVDPALNLIKGLGGALLREKIVARAAARFVAVVDESKVVESLTQLSLVPVEVVPFGWSGTWAALEELGASPTMRRTSAEPGAPPFVSDGGHYILDCRFADISDPGGLAARIKALTGVVEHGLFIGMAGEAVVGRDDGTVTILRRTR
ncbi:MAG TPA: ribose-5-phosphate isomerase RpiA [Chloroflexota bacterium]|nr:ribose-5-phosphate isomerase RpiA [Chloroflexota bacterium]